MTIEELQQYADKVNEVRLWAAELDSICRCDALTDCVKSRKEWLTTKIESLRNDIEVFDAFMDTVDDSQLRQIIFYHYVMRYSWVKTAHLIGGGNSECAVRLRVYRYIQQHG